MPRSLSWLVRRLQTTTVTMRSTLIAVLFVAAGCVGQVGEPDPSDPLDPDPGTMAAGRTVYIRDVHPVVNARCSGGACHSQLGATGMYGFADPVAATSYSQLTATPGLVGAYTASTAGVLTKISAGHKGLTYTPAETAAITQWLAQEVTDREQSGQPLPIDPVARLAAWTGCMSLENFAASNMTTAWSTLGTSQNQSCLNCHNGGLATFLVSADEAVFFRGVTEQKDFLLKYFTVGSAGEVIVNTAAMRSAGENLEGHPRFNPTTNAGMTALAELHPLTLARQTAGTCDPPRLLP